MSDLKVIPLHKPETPEPDPDNVEVLRRLTEATAFARNGHCNSLAIVMLDEEGNSVDCWYCGGSTYSMIGALEALKLEFIMANIDQR